MDGRDFGRLIKRMLTKYSSQVQLLINAHEMWKNEKYRFISDKVSISSTARQPEHTLTTQSLTGSR